MKKLLDGEGKVATTVVGWYKWEELYWETQKIPNVNWMQFSTDRNTEGRWEVIRGEEKSKISPQQGCWEGGWCQEPVVAYP